MLRKEDFMKWAFKEGSPIYTQLIDQMKMHIASGAFNPGDQIPSVRELALDAGVNPNTMQRALAELEREELLYSVRTSGRFVTEDKAKLDGLQKILAQNYIEEMFDSLRKIGMNENDIIAAVQQHAKGE